MLQMADGQQTLSIELPGQPGSACVPAEQATDAAKPGERSCCPRICCICIVYTPLL